MRLNTILPLHYSAWAQPPPMVMNHVPSLENARRNEPSNGGMGVANYGGQYDAKGANGPPEVAEWSRTKVCRVCGDRALSFNFGVVTCESCKAFFRRNGTRMEEFVCPYNGNCPTSIDSRRYCQSCRLRKCFAVGMRLDAISKRRHNAPLSRIKTSQPATPGCTSSDKGDGVSSQSPSDTADKRNIAGNISGESDDGNISFTISLPSLKSIGDKAKDGDLAKQLLSSIKASLSAVTETSVQFDAGFGSLTSGYQKRKQEDNTEGHEADNGDAEEKMNHRYNWIGEKRQRTVDHQLSPPILHPSSTTDQQFPFCFTPFSGQFSHHATTMLDPGYMKARNLAVSLDMKYAKLEELLAAHDEWNHQQNVYFPLTGPTEDEITSKDLYNLTMHIFTLCIKQNCFLLTFKQLHKIDQMKLINARIFDVVLIRLSINYDKSTSNILVGYPGCNEISADVMKRYGNAFHKELLKLGSSYPDKFRNNDTIIVLLSVICLFNPDDLDVTNSDAVDFERRIYMQLLKEYFESTFGEEGRWGFEYICTWLSCVAISTTLYKPRVRFEIDPATFDISELDVDEYVAKNRT